MALAVSLISLAVALVALNRNSRDLDQLVDDRIQSREQRFIDAYAPKFRSMLEQTGTIESSEEWNPRSLEEMFAPVIDAITGAPSDAD